MTWIHFALLAPAVLTSIIFIDKYIIGNAVRDFRGLVLVQSLAGIVGGTLFWLATGFPVLPFLDSMVILWSGMISTFASAIYFKVLKEEESSYVIFMFQLIPIFVIILSWLILGETISLKEFLGFSLILASSLAISKGKNQRVFHLSKSFFLLLIMDFFFALSAVLVTFAIDATSFAKILSYESWGIGLGGLVLYVLLPSARAAFHDILLNVRKKILAMMFLNEGFYITAKSLAYYAYSLGPVALVSVIGSTQVFMGIFAGWFLTLLFPQIFKENIRREDLAKKLVLAGVLIAGIMLVF